MNMLRHWEKLLRVFPFSRLSKSGSTLRVNALSFTEPALYEQSYNDPINLDVILAAAKEYMGSDCAAQLEAKWDLWQFSGEWKLTPTRVNLLCFASEFEDRAGDHLRVEFGTDSIFMPDPELPNNLFMAQSNLKSLLQFVHEADQALSVEQRRLWTESGENFAERLQKVLSEP